ncbi:MAG: L,D-transpeptidase [Chthoniobacterales bacterium]
MKRFLLFVFLFILVTDIFVVAEESAVAPFPVAQQEKVKVIPRVLERAKKENVSIVILLAKQRILLLVDEEIAVDSPISSGRSEVPTPKGDFKILQKHLVMKSPQYGEFVNEQGLVIASGVNPELDSIPSGATFRELPMENFLVFNEAGLGMYAAELPGYRSSNGGVRLPDETAKLFFKYADVGAPVKIKD